MLIRDQVVICVADVGGVGHEAHDAATLPSLSARLDAAASSPRVPARLRAAQDHALERQRAL